MSAHIIEVYGKPGCGMCEDAKRKLTLLKRVAFGKNLNAYLNDNKADWRKPLPEDPDGPTPYEVRAALAINDERYPLFRIDGQWMSYPEAMRFLKDEARQRMGADRKAGA